MFTPSVAVRKLLFPFDFCFKSRQIENHTLLVPGQVEPRAFMAEALGKTFKRDYVFCNDRPNAETVMAQLPCWFEDYNENAPHKTLRMLSPREFIRSLQNLECPV